MNHIDGGEADVEKVIRISFFAIDDEHEGEHYCYISTVATLTNMHQQTIRHYEKLGLIKPKRSKGNRRLYTTKDIQRLRLIRTLSKDMGVNLAGIEIILKLLDDMEKMRRKYEEEISRLREELRRYRALLRDIIEDVEM